jgi:hypothetical protein
MVAGILARGTICGFAVGDLRLSTSGRSCKTLSSLGMELLYLYL